MFEKKKVKTPKCPCYRLIKSEDKILIVVFFQICRKMAQALDEEAMKSLLKWIDSIPLSRPKKNLARDFSDGVLAAEIIKVDLENSRI